MDEQARRIDLTTTDLESNAAECTDAMRGAAGSTWAELDEEFFRIVQDVFPHQYCFGASVLLASNDELVIELPQQRTASAQRTSAEILERLNAEIDRELEIRRAMRRHPSRRRF